MGTPLRYTTKFSGRSGGSWRTANAVYANLGGVWKHCRYIYVKQSGSWVGVYSTPDVSVSGGGGNTGSGASPNGSASVGASASLGGTHSGSISYSWTRLSGDTGIAPNNAGISNPTFSRSFTGVPNGSNSGGVSADWRCTVTDTLTGAQVVADLTIGPLSWTNTIPAFTPYETDYYASATVPIPAGATGLTVILIGGSGSGGFGISVEPGPTDYPGGYGGSGGRVDLSRSVSSGDWGSNLSLSIDAGGGFGIGGTASLSGALSISASATGGQAGGAASSDPAPGANGSGGSGSGGSVTNGATGAGGSPGSGNGSYGDNRGGGFIRLSWT